MSQDHPMTRRRLLGGVTAVSSAALAGCTSMTPFVGLHLEETETIDPSDAETVSIVGDVGTVSAVGSDRDDLFVEVEKQSSSIRSDLEQLVLDATHHEDALELQSVYEAETGWMESEPTMDLDLEVPKELALEHISTSVGQVTIREVTGDLTIESSTGTVDVEGVDGAVGAETSTGRVEIRDVERLNDVRTSTGRVDVEVPAIDGDTSITTSTGQVEAAVSPDIDAELEVRTSTGRIDVDVDDLEIAESSVGSDVATGTLGDGGPRLRIETSTGRVTVRSLED